METIRTGIIGYGMAGKVFHAPFIQHIDGFTLSKISTTNVDSIAHAHENYPQAKVVGHADEILNDKDIDLVIVLTPNEFHFPLAKAALLAGKHVVVDKPFTVTSVEADELIGIARQQGKVLTVYHNRRWAADYKTIKKILKAGWLGRLVEYSASYNRFRPELRPIAWREKEVPGSGILYDLGSHLIDQALELFGFPKEITANIQFQRDGVSADDYFHLTLQYPGLNVYLHSGMLVKVPGPNFILHGDNGSFIKSGMDVQEEDLKSGRLPMAEGWGVEPKSQSGVLTSTINDMPVEMVIESDPGSYTDFFLNLRDTIWGKADLIVSPKDARDVIRIIELAFQSAKEKRTIVC